MLLHRKNDSREASSRSVSRCGRLPAPRRRILLEAEDEARTGEDALESALDAGVEAPLLTRLVVERQIGSSSAVADRLPIGASRQPPRICCSAHGTARDSRVRAATAGT